MNKYDGDDWYNQSIWTKLGMGVVGGIIGLGIYALSLIYEWVSSFF